MKKICFYTDTVFTIGGIQRVVASLANSLISDYDITIICQYKTPHKKIIDYNIDKKVKIKIVDNSCVLGENVIFFPIKALRKIISKLHISNKISKKIMHIDYGVFRKKKLIKLFFIESFDYILAEGLNNCIYLSYLKKDINSKIIGCWHSSYESYTCSSKYDLNDILFSLKTLDETIVLSQSDVKSIKDNFSIDVKRIGNFISDLSVTKSKLDSLNFVAVGRYDKIKGYDRLINIFKRFNEYNDTWKLYIVGDGAERDSLQNLINKLGLDGKVILTGQTNDVVKYYHQSSVYLLSSHFEGFPMVILEAMKYGLPIVAFDIPVLHELLPNNEYIANQDDEDKYLDLMKKISNSLDLRKKIGELNANKCTEYYESVIIGKWKKLLK